MTPNLGQGAYQAPEVAVTLAAGLAAGATVESAPARCDAERRPQSVRRPRGPSRQDGWARNWLAPGHRRTQYCPMDGPVSRDGPDRSVPC